MVKYFYEEEKNHTFFLNWRGRDHHSAGVRAGRLHGAAVSSPAALSAQRPSGNTDFTAAGDRGCIFLKFFRFPLRVFPKKRY